MKTVFFDVDTQIDFLFPSGALYAPGAERMVGTIARLNQYAGANGAPLISTMDAHGENDPEFKQWPAHCVEGTVGQQKPQGTLLETRTVIPWEPVYNHCPNAQQIILEKIVLDCFQNPNLPRLLEQLEADRYVVYGLVMEICVRCAAFGLLRTGKRVELVTDAVCALNTADGEAMLEEYKAQGGALTSAASIL
jgi:nicotinamidase/pyrazinamidase